MYQKTPNLLEKWPFSAVLSSRIGKIIRRSSRGDVRMWAGRTTRAIAGTNACGLSICAHPAQRREVPSTGRMGSFKATRRHGA